MTINPIIEEDLKNIYIRGGKIWDDLNHKTVFITGGTGLIGTYLVCFLIYLNEEVDDFDINIIIHSRDLGKIRNIYEQYYEKPYFKVITGDLRDSINLDCDVDYILHAGGMASPQYHNSMPADVITVNTLGTYHTLELGREKNCKGYLFFSANVFGKLEKELITEEDYGELEPISYKNCYTEGKRAGEVMCKCYTHQYGIPARIVRPCHTYGPTMDINNDQRVFSSFVGNVVRGENIEIKSDGSAIRNFCYIADAVLGYYLVLLKGAAGEIYNVSNEDARCSMRELAEYLCSLFPDKGLKACFGKPDKSYLENVHKIMPNYSSRKLNALGWKAEYGIEKGFERTVNSLIGDFHKDA